MLSRIQLGVVARDYLHFRSREVPHFEKKAEYIKPFFVQSQKLFCEGAWHEIEIDCFCEDLALYIFKDEPRIHKDLLPEDTYLGMCYVLCKGILFNRGICVGEPLRKEVHEVAVACDIPSELVLLFFRTIADEIWATIELKKASTPC